MKIVFFWDEHEGAILHDGSCDGRKINIYHCRTLVSNAFGIYFHFCYKLENILTFYLNPFCPKTRTKKTSTSLLVENVAYRTLLQFTIPRTPYLIPALKYRSSSMKELRNKGRYSNMFCRKTYYVERKSVRSCNRLRRNSICQWIALHDFQNCHSPNATGKIQNTHFWHCNVGIILHDGNFDIKKLANVLVVLSEGEWFPYLFSVLSATFSFIFFPKKLRMKKMLTSFSG